MNPGFFSTVFLLLKTARKRSIGRAKRQKQLLSHKTGSSSDALKTLGYFMMFLFMGGLNIAAAFTVQYAIKQAQGFSIEKRGRVIVSGHFQSGFKRVEKGTTDLSKVYEREAERRTEKYGGSQAAHEQLLRESDKERLIDINAAQPGIKSPTPPVSFAAMLGSFALVWWLIMLTFQGEGLELDLQRRRHPIWEWLLSHPVRPGAVFLAEMISPFASNPIYLTAPLFSAFLFGSVYGPVIGLLALPTIGLPIAVAAACLSKALEISIMLRCPPRSRGAIIGFMSWLGYAALISFVFGIMFMPKIVYAAGNLLYPIAQTVPSPIFNWVIGAQPGGSFSFIQGMLFCWLIVLLMIGGGVAISVWSTQKGLSGSTSAKPVKRKKKPLRFGKDPLHRKELLWFIRDRGAIVQVFLIPLTIAAVQLINLRRVLEHAGSAWHTLAGAAVIFGTYFLWVLGPRSLASEGSALWIAQTWPRGMEDLLKAKAKLWFVISSFIVFLVLALAALKFPSDSWKLALIGIGWLAFGSSMAEKTVTLVAAPSSSGEPEKIPASRRMAAALGMLTFGIGILTKQWHLACLGITYSWMTAAAMWQNFRARLPYLFDPWEEKLPPPPTVMHAMIAISVLIEFGAIFSGIFIAAAGREHMAPAQAIAYTLIAAIVVLITCKMMNDRGLPPKEIWNWKNHCKSGKVRLLLTMGAGALIGLLLALFARGYLFLIQQIGPLGEMIQSAQEQMDSVEGLKTAYFIMAVCVAPFAEEFLFRGMLFRALDKEWGGWKALLGSSAFFAIYHSPAAWIPVGLLGLINAIIFKKTGRLAAAVTAHLVYNAIVLM